MRRVFPVRHAENGDFANTQDLGRRLLQHVEGPIKGTEEQRHVIGNSQKVMKLPKNCDSSTISGDENLNNINSSDVMVCRPLSHQKPPRASAYPIFTAGASHHRYTSSLSNASGNQKLSADKLCKASFSCNLSYDSQRSLSKEAPPDRTRNQAERPISAPKNRPLSGTGSQKYSLRTQSFRHAQLPDNITVLNGTDEDFFHGFTDRQHCSVRSHSRSFSFATSEASFSESSELSSCFTKGTESSESITSKKSSPNGRTGRGNSPFKYLSARMVAEKLVKVLGKEKSKSHPNRHIGSELPRPLTEERSCALSKELSFPTEKEILKQDLCFNQSSLEFPDEIDNNASEFLSASTFILDNGSDRSIKQYNCCILESNFQRSLEARALAREKLAHTLDKENTLCDAKFRSRGSDNCAADGSTWDVNKLKQEIKKLRMEKKDLALEVAHEIRARISEQNVAVDRWREMKMETELKVLAIEKNKDILQEIFEKELEQRVNEWSAKLEKMKCEERTLQERVNELSEDKAELQKVVSSFREKETSWRKDSINFESLLSSLKERLVASEAEMARRMQTYVGTLEKAKASDNDFETLAQQDALLQMENSELQNEVRRLRRICNDQEMTIEGLWQELDETVNGSFDCRSESLLRLQRELLRLAGVEQGLRSEVNAMYAELKLKQDKNAANAGTPADLVKLNQELQDKVEKLQSKAVFLQEENKKLTLNLRATMRAQRDAEKIIELYQLEDSTGVVENSSLSERTADSINCEVKTPKGLDFPKHILSEENLRVLNSKLQLKEAELKKLDEEVLEILHSRESLQMEVDDLHEKLLVASQRNRELEREMDRKEVAIEVIQADAERLSKELTGLQSDLSCIRRQRDGMRKEAEDMSREALRLTMELNEAKTATEKLEEELMLKEGQISILRGTYTTSDFLS